MLRIVGGREMRVDGVDDQMRAGCHLRKRPLEIVVSEAETIHAGVDLQMAVQAFVVACGCRLKRAGRARRGDGRRQIVREDPVEIADAQRAENEDGRADAGLPQDDGLFDVRAGEHRGAGILERLRDLRRAVAVRVRLDDGDDARRGARRRSEKRSDRVEVRADSLEIDPGNRRPDHWRILSKSSRATPRPARDSRSACAL
jgi:hypothetical protein